MNDLEWPDPLRVSAHVGHYAGRTAWAVAHDGHVLAADALNQTQTRIDALMGILEVLLKHEDLTGMPIDLATNDRQLRSVLESNRDIAANIEPLPACRVSVCDAGLEQAAEAARIEAEAAGPIMILAATDGARERHAPVGGFGWVTSDGTYGHGFIRPTSPVEAELVAIADLLEKMNSDQPLVILVDSAHARRLAGAALRGEGTNAGEALAVNNVIARIAGHAGRDVSLRNVAGHSGDPLNEGAHRLAVLSRRAPEWSLSKEKVDEMAARIAQETAELVGSAA